MSQIEYVLNRESVRAVDRAAVQEYGIPGIVLMENAARGLADQVLRMLGDAQNSPPTTLIVCGSGNNGGDGYAMGRHLHNAGIKTVFVKLGESRSGTDAAINREICLKMGLPEVPLHDIASHADADLIVDAIFGTGLDRPVSGPAAQAIEWINGASAPVLAVDVPSGLDCDTGEPLGTTVRADCTVTFVAKKPGLITA
ncbi:MAG: NAD(P)H-hydrate epimerase, partial [Phycisphaerales bacterium]